ncbi:hypothetical protein HYX14_04715 [Candidatus Woesearchaeota archaeon]|nr:hypothetical protein [Candidatus Woesearchaeota archaeon]
METYASKSVVISRKPGKDRDGPWTAMISLFDENNPHLKAKVPLKVVEIPKVEKVRIKELRNVSYYLRGNDIVINNLVKINVETKEGVVTLTGIQELPK